MSRTPPNMPSTFATRPARYESDTLDAGQHRLVVAEICERLDRAGGATPDRLRDGLCTAGLSLNQPRLARMLQHLDAHNDNASLTPEEWGECLPADSVDLIRRALDDELVIAHFGAFKNRLANLFAYTAENEAGQVAEYIPELAKADARTFGLSVCTIDGQTAHYGETGEPVCLQSTMKPLNYALGLALNGEALVHRHVGREPSGQRFDELTLDSRQRPHNPMINAGAIICSALLKPGRPIDERLSLLQRFIASAAGGNACGFDAAVHASEAASAERNVALAEFLRDHGAFPEGAVLEETLDLYFRSCALTLNMHGLSTVAATLANGGVCPTSGHRVIEQRAVRNTLSLMLTCGMYDFSGEYAFNVGLPAKSGVSGTMMIVIPGVCGVGLWSPPLDSHGNPVRGVEFSRRLVDSFPFHVFAGTTT
jgi:glutaminase